MELGIITDEVHSDFQTACEHVAAWGVPLIEIRNVDGKNAVLLEDDEVARALETVRRHGLRVSGIASPVFKSPLDERPTGASADFIVAGAETVDAQLRLLERACMLAKRFDTRLVRVFTFLRVPWSDAVVDDVAKHMARAAEIAAEHDVVLAIENEPACVVGTGDELGRFFARLDALLPEALRRHVGALWDPGNALAIGEERPYPDGYRALPAGRLVHVHLKDLGAEPASFGTFVPLGKGRIDYEGQFLALENDGYGGSVVLEPHYAPAGMDSAAAAKVCVDAARTVLAAAATEN
ncbi:MAG: sugar phosphate isomerase/epimerase family protein [Trueperaceae bacterium]